MGESAAVPSTFQSHMLCFFYSKVQLSPSPNVLNLPTMQTRKLATYKFPIHKANQNQNISGYSGVINLLTSPTTFRADTKKCCDKELSVTSVPDTCDYKRSSVTGLGQPCWDQATLPPENIQFKKCFPTPSLEMTFLFQCVQLQKEATNGSDSNHRRPWLLCSLRARKLASAFITKFTVVVHAMPERVVGKSHWLKNTQILKGRQNRSEPSMKEQRKETTKLRQVLLVDS